MKGRDCVMQEFLTQIIVIKSLYKMTGTKRKRAVLFTDSPFNMVSI